MDKLEKTVQEISNRLPQIVQSHYFSEIGSTNEEAKRLGKEGAPDGTLVVANGQSQGKGRMNRTWESPEGKGLYFTLLIRPELKPEDSPLINLTSGLALGNSIKKLGLPPLIIKWPNDIWIEGKKIAGVLPELFIKGKDLEFVLVGVGVNVHQNPEDFSPELRSKAGSLNTLRPQNWDRGDLLVDLLSEIYQENQKLIQEGTEMLVQRWEKESGMLGRPIKAEILGKEQKGTAAGLNPQGHLILEKDDGEKITLIAEDTSLIL